MREHGRSRFIRRRPQPLLLEGMKYCLAYSKNWQALSIKKSSFSSRKAAPCLATALISASHAFLTNDEGIPEIQGIQVLILDRYLK
jgi:hypothetical protein